MASSLRVPPYIALWRRQIPKPPLLMKGDPQHRVVLPQFWMKIVKPKYNMPSDHVKFIVHPQMSKEDVKQYLLKIYDIPVIHIKTAVRQGDDIVDPHQVTKVRWRKDDYKEAFVQLAEGHTFTFPDVLEGVLTKREKVEKADEGFKAKSTAVEGDGVVDKEIPSWFR